MGTSGLRHVKCAPTTGTFAYPISQTSHIHTIVGCGAPIDDFARQPPEAPDKGIM